MKQLALVEGDVNLLAENEILVSEEEGYTILRKRLDSGDIKTFVVVPLEDFRKDGDNSRKKVEET
nr:MAG TPA: hypothetical protein [Crassvirales sp.]